MAIRFENIKEFIGSRVSWDDRADLFTPEAAAAIRAKVEAGRPRPAIEDLRAVQPRKIARQFS